jgi:Cof subfamily protein (haloacid dehalogenase superfamily)
MKAKIKMIATDLDDTLLRADKTVSDYSWNVLRKCRETGIKIVYATGRGGSAERLALENIFDGKITMNGAVVKIDDNIVYKKLIPHELARPILMACDKRGLKTASETNETHYANFNVAREWPRLSDYFQITDFARHNIDAEKLYMVVNIPEDIAFIENLLPENLHMLMALGNLAMIMHKEASKSQGVAQLAKIWNISSNEIAAFGDDFNDIDLLSYAGTGVAMGNAVSEAKAMADFICDSNENDGLAKWVEENIL